jgi:cyclophilin family peptidyl-prolyl cis-trans isomerase
MKSIKIILLAIFIIAFAGKGFSETIKQEGNILADDKNVVVKFETTLGDFKVTLFMDKAPITAGNFKSLVEEGFFNGIIFHRVIDGFMIQGGDPTGTGRGGSKKIIPDEFGEGLKHDKKGMLSMANSGPNTGSSQFFITLAPTPWLDGKHAIFGEVTEGMDIVEKIGKTQVGPGDRPVTEVKMIKVTIE